MGSISLLLVDDKPLFLDVLNRFLGQYFCGQLIVLGTAHTGREALQLAERLQPELILLDLALPDIFGLDAIPQLRAMLPDVLIIVLTWYQSRGYEQAAHRAGADAFVNKANLSLELLPTIRALVRKKQAAFDQNHS